MRHRGMTIFHELGNAYAWGWNAGAGHDFHGFGDGPSKVLLATLVGALITVGLIMALGAVATAAEVLAKPFRR